MARRRIKIDVGHIFGVPLTDGRFAFGQLLSIEPEALDSVGCVLYGSARSHLDASVLSELLHDHPIAVLLVTPDLLRSGRWPILGCMQPDSRVLPAPYEQYRASRWIGAKIRGSALVATFLSAFHGLVPWDDWADPEYLDSYLLAPELKPLNLMYRRHAG